MTKPKTATARKPRGPQRIKLNERQVGFLMPLVQAVGEAKQQAQNAEVEVQRALLAIAPGNAETVQLDLKTDPWTLIVEK